MNKRQAKITALIIAAAAIHNALNSGCVYSLSDTKLTDAEKIERELEQIATRLEERCGRLERRQ